VNIDQTFLARIDAVLEKASRLVPHEDCGALERECIAAATTILEAIYGRDSRQVQQFVQAINNIEAAFRHTDSAYFVSRIVQGSLSAARTDVIEGHLARLIELAAGEILLDFVELAQRALDEGRADVASVLSAAAFEDAMRRRAKNEGLTVTGKDLSELVNGLKAAGVLSKPQAQVAAAYVAFRNKALHADWDKLLAPEIAALISFVKHFAAGIPP
jgi:hypothetical protein